MNTLLLYLLNSGAIISGILVITSRNPIFSVLCLIAVFVNVACYLVLLGMSFIGITYLIIYVGAIAILFLFVVIMINIKLVEIHSSNIQGYTKNLPLGVIVGGLFLYSLLLVIPSSVLAERAFDLVNGLTFESPFKYSSVFHAEWNSSFTSYHQLKSLGLVLYSSYSIWLIVGGCILLLAIIGPICITLLSTKR